MVTNNVKGSFSARSQLGPDTLCLRGFRCGAKPVSLLQPLSRRKKGRGRKHTNVLRSEPDFKSVANWTFFIHRGVSGVSECAGFTPNCL